MKRVDPRVGLLRAARRLVLVMGAGALGAVVCSTGVYLFVPAPVETTGAGQSGGGTTLRSSPASVMGTSERRALDLLRRAGRAPSVINYQGTKLFKSWSRWGQITTTAYVRNVPGQGVTVIAHDGTGRGVSGERGSQLVSADIRPDFSDQALATLTQAYQLRVAATERLLGRSVTRIDVLRLSGTVVGKIWLDDSTGLTVQRELLDTAGRVIRRSAFTGLSILADPVVSQPSPSPSPAADDSGCDGGLSADELAGLADQGWDLPGTQLAGLTRMCARTVGTGDDRSIQLSYSDGLFTLSLFAQQGRLDSAIPAGFRRRQVGTTDVYLRCGLYRELSWARSGMVYTMVTDVPDATVVSVVDAVPTVSPDNGVLARMSKGIRRVGSWVDPFH
ncbi:sigma-E factor regulatory protein RseB domain-containing protein [Cryptosporangium sp. NPDC051539]|uniref:sigma-E factor regulatory protein RseB domain-containing protein n=1 Tax=Cryptosporangium sp. NPDC051539 TaxID=3363962 RepID=UPI00378FA961